MKNLNILFIIMFGLVPAQIGAMKIELQNQDEFKKVLLSKDGISLAVIEKDFRESIKI